MVPVGAVPRRVPVVGLAIDERDELVSLIEPNPHQPSGHGLAAELVADRGREQRRRPPDPIATAEPSALTGWRGAVGRAVARPVAKRTRFTEEQIRAAIGLALIAWAVFQIIRTAVRAANRR
jgi:hypothetical protein